MNENVEKEVLENTNQTIREYFDRLKNELAVVDSQAVGELKSDNGEYLRSAKLKLKELLSRKIHIGDIVFCLEAFDRDNLKKCLNYLETEVIDLNRTAKLSERSELRQRLNKLALTHTNRIGRDELLTSLEHDMNKMIYAKTLNEIMWLRFDEKLNQRVYLHFDYMLNLINKFMR